MEKILIFSMVLLWVLGLFNLAMTFAVVRRVNGMLSGSGSSSGMHVIDLPVGAPAPHFDAETLAGEKVNLASYAGRSAIFVFIMSHCSACRESLPLYEALAAKARKKGLDFLLVNFSEMADAQKMVSEHDIRQPMLVAAANNPFQSDYHITGVPCYCQIDLQGKIQSAGIIPELEASLG
jgi:thiol-disulfide isomerase/thioredoxin